MSTRNEWLIVDRFGAKRGSIKRGAISFKTEISTFRRGPDKPLTTFYVDTWNEARSLASKRGLTVKAA